MTVDSRVLFMGEFMARRRVSDGPAGPQTVANLKGCQAAKIREIAEGLIAEGIDSIDAQAKALGLRRSTAWTILKSKHKTSGLSPKIINCMLAQPQLPPRVRATILDYIEEKASGRYGHNASVRRKFISALSARRVGQAAHARAAPADRKNGNIRSAGYPKMPTKNSQR
jgi:hypothetical protein